MLMNSALKGIQIKALSTGRYCDLRFGRMDTALFQVFRSVHKFSVTVSSRTAVANLYLGAGGCRNIIYPEVCPALIDNAVTITRWKSRKVLAMKSLLF
jgi:hypothetical protein